MDINSRGDTDNDLLDQVARLRRILEKARAEDALLQALWVETEWLIKNARQENWVLPAAWESNILKASQNASLAKWPDVFEAACEVAALLQSHLLWTPSFTTLSSLTESIRGLSHQSSCMEVVAERVVSMLYGSLVFEQTKQPVLTLVRCFKTHGFSQLPSDLKQTVVDLLKFTPEASTKCLCLLATYGSHPDWCDRRRSGGHKVIPLTSVAMISQSPMIARLFQQLGVQVAPLLHADTQLMIDPMNQDYNVFYVPDAMNSPYIPAQDFVRENGIRSVLGYGAVLPSGELFATVMFFNTLLSYRTASMFKPIALATQLAMVPLDRNVFRSDETREQVV